MQSPGLRCEIDPAERPSSSSACWTRLRYGAVDDSSIDQSDTKSTNKGEIGATMNLMVSFMFGLLFAVPLPNAAYLTGMPLFMVWLVTLGWFSWWVIDMLVHSAIVTRSKSTYDLVCAALGPTGGVIYLFMVQANGFMLLIPVLQIAGTMFVNIFNIREQYWGVIFGALLQFPFCFLRSIDDLKFTSVFSIATGLILMVMVGVTAVLVFSEGKPIPAAVVPKDEPWKVLGSASCLGAVYNNMQNILPIFTSMSQPTQSNMRRASTMVVVAYTFMNVFMIVMGYYALHGRVLHSDMMAYFCKSDVVWVRVTSFVIMMGFVLGSGPLSVYEMIHVCENIGMIRPTPKDWRFINIDSAVVLTLVVMAAVILSIVETHLGPMVRLLGAAVCFPQMFVLPVCIRIGVLRKLRRCKTERGSIQISLLQQDSGDVPGIEDVRENLNDQDQSMARCTGTESDALLELDSRSGDESHSELLMEKRHWEGQGCSNSEEVLWVVLGVMTLMSLALTCQAIRCFFVAGC